MPSYYNKPCPKCGERVYRDARREDDGLPHLHKACGNRHRRPRPACRVCGTEVKRPGLKYCSNKCQGVELSRRVDKPCAVCGTVMSVQPHRMERKKWCSVECQAVGRIKGGSKWARNRGIGKLASPITITDCATCGELFTARNGRTYCSQKCRYAPRLEEATQRTSELYQLTRDHLRPYESQEWRKVLHLLLVEKDGDLCAVCFEPIDLELSGRDPQGPSVEHLVPRSKGGSDELDNLALSHWGCNQSRGAKDLVDVWEKTA